MKMLLLGLTMLTSVSVQAAGIVCTYQNVPCNENGDHYRCVYYGWAHGEFCSPTDGSRRMNRGPKPEPKQGEMSEEVFDSARVSS